MGGLGRTGSPRSTGGDGLTETAVGLTGTAAGGRRDDLGLRRVAKRISEPLFPVLLMVDRDCTT